MELKSCQGPGCKVVRSFKSHLYGIEINVNKEDSPVVVCLNRTFMELKSSHGFTAASVQVCLNRTFMELKFVTPPSGKFIAPSLNRTFMELKSFSRY